MNSGSFIIILALVAYVIYVTRLFNFWGVSRGANKLKADVRLEKQRTKQAKRITWFLAKFVLLHHLVGFSLSSRASLEYKYKLDRLRWQVKSLDRSLKPEELMGIIKFVQLLGVFLAVGLFILTSSSISAVFLLLLFAPTIFNAYAASRIMEEDEKLEMEFPDLFTILYSRLLRGSQIRLAPTLKDYLQSLDSLSGQSASKKVIRNFVVDLRNNIEIYGDDGMAITRLRDKYRSAMVVNFCNLASQALNGVDNSDKLLSFKIELNNKRVEQMERRAAILIKRGSRAVLLVYVILFQFILLSWIAKLTLVGGLGNILGL